MSSIGLIANNRTLCNEAFTMCNQGTPIQTQSTGIEAPPQLQSPLQAPPQLSTESIFNI